MTTPEALKPYLARMGFDKVSGLEERLMRRLLLVELKATA